MNSISQYTKPKTAVCVPMLSMFLAISSCTKEGGPLPVAEFQLPDRLACGPRAFLFFVFFLAVWIFLCAWRWDLLGFGA